MIVTTNIYIDKFIDTLDPLTRAKAIRAIDRLGIFGRNLSPPDSKKIGKNLYELRIRAEVQVRLFYGFRNDGAFLVHAITKKTSKIPKRDIEVAERRLASLA